MIKLLKLPVGILLFVSLSALANEDMTTDRTYSVFSIGGIAFDHDAAFAAGVDDSAKYVKWTYEKNTQNFIYAGGMNWSIYDDNSSFSQVTTAGEKSSSASAYSILAEVGYKYHLTNDFEVNGIVGYEHTMGSKRRISGCLNCAMGDINLEAGLYFKPRIKFTLDNKWFISASYLNFVSGDAKSAIGLDVGYPW